MQPPSSDNTEVPPDSPIAFVEHGGYVLEVGQSVGVVVAREAKPKGSAQGQVEKKDPSEAIEEIVDEASSVTTKVERADTLYEDLADGSLEVAQINNGIDSLIGLLDRLDREGKHEDALRVARTLSKLLALARRWLALLKALRTALGAAESLGDDAAIAWAKHELGTANLVTDDLIGADRRLTEARHLRGKLKDRRGLVATTRNLEALCGHLRRLVRKRELVPDGRRPALARLLLAAIVALLVAGGGVAAGMALGHDGGGSRSSDGGPPPDGSGPKVKYRLNVEIEGGGKVISDPTGIECRAVVKTTAARSNVAFQKGNESGHTGATGPTDKGTTGGSGPTGTTGGGSTGATGGGSTGATGGGSTGATGGGSTGATGGGSTGSDGKDGGAVGTCDHAFRAESKVTLTGKPAPGWRLAGFSGPCVKVSKESCRAPVTREISVALRFVEGPSFGAGSPQ